MYACHPRPLCDHWRPCWQRSGRPCMAPLEPLPLGPAAAANAPLPGMPGRALCAAIPAAHTCTIAEIFVRLGTALAAAGGGAGAQQGPAVARRPPRGCAAQLALAWRPRKGIEDAPFLGGDPRAIFGHPGQEPALHRAHAHISQAPDLLSQAQSEPLRSRLDPLDRE